VLLSALIRVKPSPRPNRRGFVFNPTRGFSDRIRPRTAVHSCRSNGRRSTPASAPNGSLPLLIPPDSLPQALQIRCTADKAYWSVAHMSVQHPSRTTRRLLQLASLGLAGLLAGLFSGCSSASAQVDLGSRNDTSWQTPQTYASATAEQPQARIVHASPHSRNSDASRQASMPSGHRHAAASYPSL
jgi:hypothetical protein